MALSWVLLKDPENEENHWLPLGTLATVTNNPLCLTPYSSKRNLQIHTTYLEIFHNPPLASGCGYRQWPLWMKKGPHTNPDKLRGGLQGGLTNSETERNHKDALNINILRAGKSGSSHPRRTVASLTKANLYLK